MDQAQRDLIGSTIKKLQAISVDIESHLSEEGAYFDALPSSAQESNQGEAAQDRISFLISAEDAVDEAIGHLESVVG